MGYAACCCRPAWDYMTAPPRMRRKDAGRERRWMPGESPHRGRESTVTPPDLRIAIATLLVPLQECARERDLL